MLLVRALNWCDEEPFIASTVTFLFDFFRWQLFFDSGSTCQSV